MIDEFDPSRSLFKRHFVKDHLCWKVLWGNSNKTLGQELKLDQTSHRLAETRTRWGKTVGIMTYYKSSQGLGL